MNNNILLIAKEKIKQIEQFKRTRAKVILYRDILRYFLPEKCVRHAESDKVYKKALLEKRKNLWGKKTQDVLKSIESVWERQEIISEENRNEVVEDMLFCYFAYGFTPEEYLSYDFYQKKEAQLRKKYISDRESVLYGCYINDIYARSLLDDKIKLYDFLSPFYKREMISITGLHDKNKYMSFVLKYPVFVVKNAYGSCGQGVRLIYSKDYDLESLFINLMKEKKVVLEELVIQSKKMAILNASSVNTVRCFTINTRHGIIIPWCFLKIGRKDEFVDNGRTGGILVGVDVKNGILGTIGIDELGNKYTRHPDSSVLFDGFKIPEWNSMLSICREIANKISKVKWIGWDMAYTDKGWIVIEGNSLSEMIGPQATWQKPLKDEWNVYLKDVDLFM